jgi:hypothetical protein
VKLLTFETNRETTPRTSLFFHSTINTSENKQQTPWRPTEAQDQAQVEKNQQPISGGEGQAEARSKSRR